MMTFKEIGSFLGSVASSLTLASTLAVLGLERRRSTAAQILPAIGAFGAGIAVGAGLGILFAPKPGVRIREDLSRRASGLAEEAKQIAGKMEIARHGKPEGARAETGTDLNGM